jgi:hypothetical protein
MARVLPARRLQIEAGQSRWGPYVARRPSQTPACAAAQETAAQRLVRAELLRGGAETRGVHGVPRLAAGCRLLGRSRRTTGNLATGVGMYGATAGLGPPGTRRLWLAPCLVPACCPNVAAVASCSRCCSPRPQKGTSVHPSPPLALRSAILGFQPHPIVGLDPPLHTRANIHPTDTRVYLRPLVGLPSGGVRGRCTSPVVGVPCRPAKSRR